MRNKLLITLCILIVLVFNGCGKKDTTPVVSETVEEEVVEETETVEETEPVEESDSTTMDELTSKYETAIELYEQVVEAVGTTDELEQLLNELNSMYEAMTSDRGLSDEEITINGMRLDNIVSQLGSMLISNETSSEDEPLTQEEIDELRSVGDSAFQMGLDAYEAIISGGTYTASSTGVVFDKVVGTPSEDGWVRVNDAKRTVYFDYDAWFADASASVPPKNEVKTAETWEDLFND